MTIALLSLLGLSISLYMLAYAMGLTGPVICNVGACETVQNSPYSRIAGIPVAAFGTGGYLILLVVAFLGVQPRFMSTRWVPLFLFGGGVVGLGFSVYLTYLEAYVIHAWCQWCVSSAMVMVLAFLFSIPEVKRLGGAW
jgi:uncharacterized membrane protein